jgi:hypothetical protein
VNGWMDGWMDGWMVCVLYEKMMSKKRIHKPHIFGSFFEVFQKIFFFFINWMSNLSLIEFFYGI